MTRKMGFKSKREKLLGQAYAIFKENTDFQEAFDEIVENILKKFVDYIIKNKVERKEAIEFLQIQIGQLQMLLVGLIGQIEVNDEPIEKKEPTKKKKPVEKKRPVKKPTKKTQKTKKN